MNTDKSLLITLIEKFPKILVAVAILVAVIRAQPGDMPVLVKNLTDSNIFCVTGWVIAVVVIIVDIVAVALYLRLKPKPN